MQLLLRTCLEVNCTFKLEFPSIVMPLLEVMLTPEFIVSWPVYCINEMLGTV